MNHTRYCCNWFLVQYNCFSVYSVCFSFLCLWHIPIFLFYSKHECISGFYVRLGYRLSLPKWKTVVRKLLNILCKTDIKISYITLRESCGLDAELLAFHIGAGIMISLWLQKVCRYSFMPLVVYLFTWRSILITWLSYIFIFIHP